MSTIDVVVRRTSVVSRRPFEEIVRRLTATIGHPEMNAFHEAVAASTTVAELEAVVHGAIGASRESAHHEGIGEGRSRRRVVRTRDDPRTWSAGSIAVRDISRCRLT